MNLRLELLGSPIIRADEELLSLPRRRVRALLYYLAAAGSPQARDRLVALIWPDLEESRARHALRSTLYQLRQAGIPIEANREAVSFAPQAQVWVDVAEFQRGVARIASPANATTSPLTPGQVAELAALYRGEFLDGFYLNSRAYEEWLYFERERWHNAYLDVLERLVEAQIQAGHYLQALEGVQQGLATDALQERFYRMAMQLLAWLGQRAAALMHYKRCVQVLRDELGTTPMDETKVLYQAILEGNILPPIGLPEVNRLAGERWPAPGHASPFVGQRLGHWLLSEVLARAGTDLAPIVLITGEPGVGKTRLVQEVLATSTVTPLWGTAHPAPLPRPYAPLVKALRADLAARGFPDGLEPETVAAVASLLPELGPSSGPTGPAQLWTALARWPLARARSAPLAIVLDDIQWADPDTLAALPALLDHWSHAPIAVIGIVRPTEAPLLATDLARHLARTGRIVVLPLAGLLPGDAVELLAWLAEEHSRATARFARQLHEATNGNPLFLLETLRTLIEPALYPQPGDWQALYTQRDLSFPADLGQTVTQRLARWGMQATQLAQLLAVATRPCDRELLMRVSHFNSITLTSALTTLITGGLVEEQTGYYAFAHDALRVAIYQAMSLDHRRALHRRVADALAGDPIAASGPLAVDLVGHYLQAGALAEAQMWAQPAAGYAIRVGAPATAQRVDQLTRTP